MLIPSSEVTKDIQNKLAVAGISLNQAVIKLILESEHELYKEYLTSGNEITIDGTFTAKVKRRGYRDPAGRGTQYTMKIDASIDPGFRSELMFKKGLNND